LTSFAKSSLQGGNMALHL